jgi:hypothetical protein
MNPTGCTRAVWFVCVIVFLAGCSDGGTGRAAQSSPGGDSAVAASTTDSAWVTPSFDPDSFVVRVDNPWFPLVPGMVFSFAGKSDEGAETGTVEVTQDTKTILGVVTTVVHDRVMVGGKLAEETFDWYAQDRAGNVWYFGEDTREYQGGKVTSTEGSWEAGKDGAKPGIVMLARPQVGAMYRQEDAPGTAEDMAKVEQLTATAQVPYGSFSGVLQTAEWVPRAPGNRELKYYVKGVGVVLEVDDHEQERIELVSVSGPGKSR